MKALWNRRPFRLAVIGLCLALGFAQAVQAQDVSVRIGQNEVALNQYFTISITIQNDNIRQHSAFPDIEGFVKRGTSSSSSTSIVNGQVSSSHTITQNYQPTEKGTFTYRPFRMSINGKEIAVEGGQVTVGDVVQQQRRRSAWDDPFDSFFNRPSEPTEYIDVKADAFLALTTSKDEVYVGEGFTTTLAFYVAEGNRAEMRFYDVGNQVTEIVKKIKPEQCWEENFNIEQISGEPITLNGKRFDRYMLYQATFFPLGVGEIKFPSVDLTMIKYRVARNPSFFGQNRQQDFEKFVAPARTVKVKELPPHPLRDQVAVGQYQLRERVDNNTLETGQSFTYHFDVMGVGNISGVAAPTVPESADIDFYTPNVRQNINRSNGRITGTKSFSYYGIPNEPGTYDLGDYFQWVYFNPSTRRYDTLRSEVQINVTGESRQNESILSNDMGTFYDRIYDADNTLRPLGGDAWVRWLLNGLVLVMVGLTAWIIFRRPV